MKKKVFATLLLLCMLVTLVPTMAFAADDGAADGSNVHRVFHSGFYVAADDGGGDASFLLFQLIQYPHFSISPNIWEFTARKKTRRRPPSVDA